MKKQEPIVVVKEEGPEFVLEFNDAALTVVRDLVRQRTGNLKAKVTHKILETVALSALEKYLKEKNEGEKEMEGEVKEKKQKRVSKKKILTET